jgi:hypothetical protein
MDNRISVGDMQLARDHTAATWVVESTIGESMTIGALLPVRFEAYAEIFHPAYRLVEHNHAVDNSCPVASDGPERTQRPELLEVRWDEVARANQRTAHALMDWVTITGDAGLYWSGSQPGIWDSHPARGSLAPPQRRRLGTILSEFTSTVDRVWFAIWAGFGGLVFDRDSVPYFEMPQREMVLFTGPLSAITTSLDPYDDQSVSLWWPDDRAWCVATDVDLLVTYVGGSERCISAITGSGSLEAYRVPGNLPTYWDKDTINPSVPESPKY